MKKLIAESEKNHLLQAIDHKVHHLHIPGETIGDMGFLQGSKMLRWLDEGKVWQVWFFPPEEKLFS